MNLHLRYFGAVGGVGAIYWLSAKAGLQLAYLHGSVAALWPPVGVGMAALVPFGPGLWPGIVIGDLAVANFSQPVGTVVGQTIGNVDRHQSRTAVPERGYRPRPAPRTMVLGKVSQAVLRGAGFACPRRRFFVGLRGRGSPAAIA